MKEDSDPLAVCRGDGGFLKRVAEDASEVADSDASMAGSIYAPLCSTNRTM